jgi:translocation and assembly module TamA
VITGLPADAALPVAKVRAQLPLADGAPFDYGVYDDAKEQLRAVVEDAGYAHVKLDAYVLADRVTRTATIVLAYDAGPKSKFGPIEITGVSGALRDAVAARLPFRPGQAYSLSAITKAQRSLYALNRFSTVRVQPDKSSASATVPVTVDVTHASRHEVRLGGGVGLDPAGYEVRGRIGYSVTGWPTPLDTAVVDLRPAYGLFRDDDGYDPRLRALARLERQDLLWPYARGEVEAGYSYLAYEAYTSYGPSARLGFSTPVRWQSLSFHVGWDIARRDFRDIDPLIDEPLQIQIGIDHAERVGFFTQSLALDLRDNPVDPDRGAYAMLRVAEGTRFAGSAYNFVEVGPELRAYAPVGPIVIAGRARWVGMFGDLPPSERQFSGGASRHRGFGERRLAPSAFGISNGNLTSVPYGGGALVESSLETRFPIAKIGKTPIGGVVFLDGGDVTENVEDLDLLNLHWAIGLGARVHTIVGPVRVDVGYRLNRKGPLEPQPGSSYAFHISLGEAF